MSVSVSVFLELPVGGRAIAVDERSWTYRCLDKWHQVLVVTTINLLNPDSSKTFGLQHLHRYGNQNFGGVALAPSSTDWVYSISECKIGFIDLDLPME